ncbi:YfhO family protein, partial [Patescibacteria group bacterium]|nr:YfhO family protein [Patescibacteria group bacterium]
MWLFTRELGLSKPAAALASVSFAFSGYMVIWFELNTVGHAALWLPLILWGIERWIKTKKYRYIFPLIFGQTASMLAGHLQTTVYVFAVAAAFFLFRVIKKRKRKKKIILPFIVSMVVSLILASPQLLPTLRFMSLTPRGTQADEQIFTHFILPAKHLITFFAHDYYGNPAVENFWGVDYGEFMGFFGVVALFFAIVAISNLKTSEVKFFAILAVVALLFALPTPLVHLLRISKLPILSTSAPSRTLFIVQVSGAILAGFGVEHWLKRKAKLKAAAALLAVVFLSAWTVAAFGLWRSADAGQAANWKVTLRNLIPPTSVFAVTIAMALFAQRWGTKARKHLMKVSFMLIFLLALVEYSYFANKFQTFSERRFFFPQSPIYEFLRERSKKSPDRFFGDYTASVTSNSWVPYRVYGVEGYDSLYLRRFGELLAASEDGMIPKSIPRSDANLVKNQDDARRRRLQDLMGVKYILDKNDNPQSDWEPDPHRFPPERYQLIWQQGKFKVYENTQALPRAFLVNNYLVETDAQEIIDKIFDPEFDLKTTLILEEEMSQELSASEGSLEFISYSPNTVELKVETPTRQLLFLSDAFYPGWVATVDGEETKIYRANYAFRAIVVPLGSHTVIFKYKPKLLQ